MVGAVGAEWAAGRRTSYPSPVVHDGLLYTVASSGMLDVVDVKTGKSVYQPAAAGGAGLLPASPWRAAALRPGHAGQGGRVQARPEVRARRGEPARRHGQLPGVCRRPPVRPRPQNLYCISAKASEKAKE